MTTAEKAPIGPFSHWQMTRESACILSHAFLRNWQLRVIWAVFMDMGAIAPPAGYDGARYVEETAEAVEAKESQIMPRLFGTDGVRGLANRDLTARLALDLGDAAVRVLGNSAVREGLPEGRRRALIGRDTRVSGDFWRPRCAPACLLAAST